MPTFDQIKGSIVNNELLTDEELQLFELLYKKYGFKTISEYAKLHNLTYKGVEYQIKNRLVQFIEVNGKILLF